jgi:hypothetical protein
MKSRMLCLWTCRLAFALVLTAGVGCGSGGGGVKKVTVTGTATYDGKPIENGAIEFFLRETSLKGGDNTTGHITGGKFSVAGVSPGKNVVTISRSTVGATGPASYSQMPKMPKMDEMIKQKGKSSGSEDIIPPEAPGNGQTHDIQDGMGPLKIEILKK